MNSKKVKPVYIAADNIISPLGNSTEENFEKVKAGLSGIRRIDDNALADAPFYASMFPKNSPYYFNPEDTADYNPDVDTKRPLTRFEHLCIDSIQGALAQTQVDPKSPDTLFILSTTKGNIELIWDNDFGDMQGRVSLPHTAQIIASHIGFANKPLVLSNACISGALAIIIARRLLQAGQYKHAVITGADVLSNFIISGFRSLNAMSTTECRPFDNARDGINLGECAATVVLTTDETLSKGIVVAGGASTNDANHISGPSRTGFELAYAVSEALKESNVNGADLALISAHGTATRFNDEMEAKAFNAASIAQVPLNSLKGNFGHTLGAAGVLESILTYRSLQEGVVLPTRNYETPGVTEPVNVNAGLTKSDKRHALKTASGFGGCNAAVIFTNVR
jgi:3-oxoacyl-[acyl-carrier-protein] synthase-1